MLVVVALVRVMDVAGLIAMMLVRVALMGRMSVLFRVVLVVVALVLVVDVTGLVAVMLVAVAFVDVVLLQHLISFLKSSQGLVYHATGGYTSPCVV